MQIDEQINLSILTSKDLLIENSARYLLTFLNDEFPQFAPEWFGNYEPLRAKYTCVDDALTKWSDPFLWKTRDVRGSIFMEPSHSMSCLVLSVSVKHAASKSLPVFLQRCSEILEAEFAYLMMLTQAEVDAHDYDDWYHLSLGLFDRGIRAGCRILPWATVWGRSFKDYFLKLPESRREVFECRQLAGGIRYMQLTPSLTDMRSEYKKVVDARQAVWALMKNGPLIRLPSFES